MHLFFFTSTSNEHRTPNTEYRIPMMMSFYKKRVNFFLNFSNTYSSPSPSPSPSPRQSLSTGGGLGLNLITVSGDMMHRRPNVLEWASVKSTPPSSPPAKKEFIDDIGGEVDGLMSCTESLGFESSDERRMEVEIFEDYDDDDVKASKKLWRRKVGGGHERREVKKYPPPISSLNQNGQPSFFLKPVRKDGRLELTEVRIDRPEILRASRQDGRLRLHLVRDNYIEEEEEEEEDDDDDDLDLDLEQDKFPVTGEGFRRCHEVINYHRRHHHHNLHVWNLNHQHCVTIR